jgi:hypothetical protein
MPLITCEMRWFLEGPLPEEALRWFASGAQPAAPAWREDRYLLAGTADMGIKDREGRFEIKGRIAKLGAHAITSEIEGSAERWCKWSYDAAAISQSFRACLQGPETIVVGKGRVQRHFLLHPGDLPQEMPQRDLARRGFSLELTRIRVASSEKHWSLGIEAAPDDPALLPDLLSALRNVLKGFPARLPRSCSRSYPQWLLAVGDAARQPDR